MPRLIAVVLVTASALFVGCSGKTEAPPPPDAERRGRLKEVHELLTASGEQRKKPPVAMADVRPLENAYPGGYDSLRKGDIVAVWGVLPEAGSAAVLAHEKKTPTEGGLVLLSGGEVKEMTAAEFAAAPKAGKK